MFQKQVSNEGHHLLICDLFPSTHGVDNAVICTRLKSLIIFYFILLSPGWLEKLFERIVMLI